MKLTIDGRTAYAYTESTGANYEALVNPSKVEAFSLPGVNPFMPTATALVAELLAARQEFGLSKVADAADCGVNQARLQLDIPQLWG